MNQLQYWECKGSSLATACLCSNHYVAPSEYEGDAFRLYRRGKPAEQGTD